MRRLPLRAAAPFALAALLAGCGQAPPVIERLDLSESVEHQDGVYTIIGHVSFSDDGAVDRLRREVEKGPQFAPQAVFMSGHNLSSVQNFPFAFQVTALVGPGPLTVTLVAIDDDDLESDPATGIVELL